MDTSKIDWVIRAYVMAPILGFLALSVLFPVFVTIDAGYASADIGVFTIGIKKIHVAMDWILATSAGITGAALVIYQIYQAGLRDKERTNRDAERTKLVLDKSFRDLIIAAAENIRLSEASEGYFYFDGEELKYIICWRHDEVNPRISQLNMMFRIMKSADSETSALESLRSRRDPNRWSFRILIPLFDERYGTVSESSIWGRAFSEFDLYSHQCITHAVSYIQILDCNEMQRCRIEFDENDLRDANDAYLRTNIITQVPKFSES